MDVLVFQIKDTILCSLDVIPRSLLILATVFCLYCVHYYIYAVRKPMVYISHGTFRSFVEENIPSLYRRYYPTPWCTGTHSMTIMRFFFKSKPHIEYNRELIQLDDGGCAALDWPVQEPEGYNEQLPICLLLPGVAGHSRESYLLNWVLGLRKMGIRSVVFLNRGAGGNKLKTAMSYDGYQNLDDLRRAVCLIKDRYPVAPIIVGGTSMGGITLVHYLATYGRESHITAALIQSAGWCIFESIKSLSKPSNMIFNLYLTHRYKSVIEANRDLFEDDGFNVGELLKCRTVQEIHKRYVVPRHGYENVEDYWNKLSPHRQLLHVKIPLLCLNAADDVFSPEKSIPVHLTEKNPNIAFVVTAKGGHIGFMEGLNPKQMGYNDILFYEFAEMIRKCLDNGELMLNGQWTNERANFADNESKKLYPVWPRS